jgi:hypothetical protein
MDGGDFDIEGGVAWKVGILTGIRVSETGDMDRSRSVRKGGS